MSPRAKRALVIAAFVVLVLLVLVLSGELSLVYLIGRED